MESFKSTADRNSNNDTSRNIYNQSVYNMQHGRSKNFIVKA